MPPVLGIRDYFGKMGFQKAILGSSGGIDSAVTLALACRALGTENVRAVPCLRVFPVRILWKMPGALSDRLNNPFDIVPIQPIYESFLSTLKPTFPGPAFWNCGGKYPKPDKGQPAHGPGQ